MAPKRSCSRVSKEAKDDEVKLDLVRSFKKRRPTKRTQKPVTTSTNKSRNSGRLDSNVTNCKEEETLHESASTATVEDPAPSTPSTQERAVPEEDPQSNDDVVSSETIWKEFLNSALANEEPFELEDFLQTSLTEEEIRQLRQENEGGVKNSKDPKESRKGNKQLKVNAVKDTSPVSKKSNVSQKTEKTEVVPPTERSTQPSNHSKIKIRELSQETDMSMSMLIPKENNSANDSEDTGEGIPDPFVSPVGSSVQSLATDHPMDKFQKQPVKSN